MTQSARVRPIVDVAALRACVAELKTRASTVVLVPTMGDLHEGHLSLVRAGAALGSVVVSIFVNPTQFGPGEDFQSYPRDLARDQSLLDSLPVVAVFAPPVELMYAPQSATWVEVPALSAPLCGAFRPGHFRGVATVVMKLLQLVHPDVIVLGQKDAQQCLVLSRMVRDLHLPVRLVIGPTVRDADGLALSSRNRYLSPADRVLALRLVTALRVGRALLQAGERAVARIEARMLETLGAGLRVDYAELRTVPELEHPEQAAGRVLLAVAAWAGRARLIDNFCLDVSTGAVRDAPLLDAAPGSTGGAEALA